MSHPANDIYEGFVGTALYVQVLSGASEFLSRLKFEDYNLTYGSIVVLPRLFGLGQLGLDPKHSMNIQSTGFFRVDPNIR